MGEIVGAAERPSLDDAAIVGGGCVIVVEEDVGAVEIGLRQREVGRGEPAGALPAIDRAEDGAQRLHAVVAGVRFKGRASLLSSSG